jgi:hypothetical protein
MDVAEILELAYRAMEEMLPGIAHIPCDIGLVNDAMMEVYRYLHATDGVDVDG